MMPPSRELYAIDVALVESAMTVLCASVGSSSETFRAVRSFTITLPFDNTCIDDMLANSDGDAAVIDPIDRTGGNALCASRDLPASARTMRMREWIDMIRLG